MLLEGRLYVGSLNPDTTKQDIERTFGRYGNLRDVWMARNPPGFAFIEYDSVADAEQALRDLDGQVVLGSRIKVEPSKGSRGGRGGGGRGGGRGGGDRRGGGMRGDSRSGFRGGSRRGRGDSDSRGGRGPPSSYSRYNDYPARGGGGAYRDDPKGRYSADPYASRYDAPSYRSRSPIRRRSPLPPTRRDFGGRDYAPASRDYGAAGGADYGSSARDYASARGYAPRDSAREYDREYRAPVASSGAGRSYDRSDFDRYSRYERVPASYADRSRRSPPPRR